MITIINKILDYIYPQTCSLCGKLNSKSLCNKCKLKIEKDFYFKKDSYTEYNFLNHYYFFKYENIIRSQFLSLKFQEKPYIYKTIVEFLKINKKSFEILKKYDIILIVPISTKRKKYRGYNQSELIAKEISKIISVKVEKNVLIKKKDNLPQSTLNKVQREQNVKDVYGVKNIEKLKNKKILLFDDIYTTGNTVSECSRVLVEQGVKKENISVLTIAKG